jgi:hypothetical protein
MNDSEFKVLLDRQWNRKNVIGRQDCTAANIETAFLAPHWKEFQRHTAGEDIDTLIKMVQDLKNQLAWAKMGENQAQSALERTNRARESLCKNERLKEAEGACEILYDLLVPGSTPSGQPIDPTSPKDISRGDWEDIVSYLISWRQAKFPSEHMRITR